ncbi:MAG: glycosyltransferase [Lachnospiraceae bacterium]|nr:glycosyltransferase [Lachnospiraceae bacterium]
MRNGEEKVSVIVPVYNTEKQLERCIRSIREQTYENLEILLVDDGSTDASSVICDREAKADERIRVIHKKNGGVSSARNEGLAQASGSFIVFVDSDDWIEKEMVAVMAEAALWHHTPLVVCDYKRADEEKQEEKVFSAIESECLSKRADGCKEECIGIDGQAGRQQKTADKASNEQQKAADKSAGDMKQGFRLSSEEILKYYLLEDETVRIPHSVWGKLFAAELIGEKRFPLIKRTEELLFSTEIFCEAKQCVYLPRAFYHYCDDREESLMHHTDAGHTVEKEIPLLAEQIRIIEQNGFEKEAELAYFCFGKRLLYFYLAFRDKILKKEAFRVKNYTIKHRKEILKSLRGSFVKKTDRMRLFLFVWSPGIYYRFVLWHDRR